MVRGVLPANLPQLQNLIKRDPLAYREEFLQQWNHYNNTRHLFGLNPNDQTSHFRELLAFISQVATYYPNDTTEFSSQLSSLLTENYVIISPEMRKSLLQSLVTLRNKNCISSIDLLKCIIPLLPRTSSPALRLLIRHTILSDIHSANIHRKNHKLNRAMQAMLFVMVERDMGNRVEGDKGDKGRARLDEMRDDNNEAMWAVVLAKELWKKNVWTDTKTVAIIALGCTHPYTKVQSASVHFFIGQDTDDVHDRSEDEQEINVRALRHQREINKKTRSGDKRLKKQLKKARKKRCNGTNEQKANFPAIELLHDPQSFSEKLFDQLDRNDRRYTLDHKLLIMQLLSRVMSIHKICVMKFYTYIIKFLSHRQPRIPSILVALTQSVHDMTPPDVIEPVIQKLAREFVHPGVASEVIAAGLNSIREISRRQPWVMNVDLLADLVEYRKSRDKSIIAAARGLLQLYREVNPSMLKRRDRGKAASMSTTRTPLPFGHSPQVAVGIEGLTLLDDHFRVLREEGRTAPEDTATWEGWTSDSGSVSDSTSEGWIDVEQGESEFVLNDSDDGDDGGPMNQRKTATITQASELATTKILTPADFALLNDLRMQAATREIQANGGSAAKRKLASLEVNRAQIETHQLDRDIFVTEADILGPRKKAKADYTERLASIQKGREGREKFGSHKGKQNKAVPSSSTNREKVKHKPIMMILGSDAVRKKRQASLIEKQRKLRAHVKRIRKTKS
ncbi:hypothetical protein APHAL10511_001371 [Amanita phalloides]|nr:hypothetical protein APHAL10511_001371 [Amanita phalloides]